MPELPEVEVVRAGLAPALHRSIVSQVEVRELRSLKRHLGDSSSFERELSGQRFGHPVRRGKFLWIPFSSHRALLAHLGMSGQILVREPDAPDDRHVRIRMWVEHPERGEFRVDFVDQRMFGSLAIDDLVPTDDANPGGFGSLSPTLPSQAQHIARDPLDPAFDDSRFARSLGNRSAGIKKLMLDQALISGIGNIYADEALWASSIHPDTPAGRLTKARIAQLLDAVREVLTRALAEGGTSFDAQYVNVNGQAGYFAHSLNAYGRDGTPCSRCGTDIVRSPFMNRSSHFCPRCQRLTQRGLRSRRD